VISFGRQIALLAGGVFVAAGAWLLLGNGQHVESIRNAAAGKRQTPTIIIIIPLCRAA
jgi:hypothetical protein